MKKPNKKVSKISEQTHHQRRIRLNIQLPYTQLFHSYFSKGNESLCPHKKLGLVKSQYIYMLLYTCLQQGSQFIHPTNILSAFYAGYESRCQEHSREQNRHLLITLQQPYFQTGAHLEVLEGQVFNISFGGDTIQPITTNKQCK